MKPEPVPPPNEWKRRKPWMTIMIDFNPDFILREGGFPLLVQTV